LRFAATRACQSVLGDGDMVIFSSMDILVRACLDCLI
jgi:hypothetical protein